ncbi:porin family protein [uncultured Flavobacterium sp.]|uniref:porin family protein n=1 Tax=uncultured Flavobacterium sp. TaxID=165435 RepID=UPI0025ECA309|nr:porin family protein [uncultured Flavobacterium sp.]
MKKIIFILLSMAGVAGVNAQSKGNVEFGLGTGLNLSTVSSTDFYGNPDTNASFNFNGSAEYYFSDRWGIKAMLMYDRKGWDNGLLVDTNTGYSVETNINMDYLTIPVMANWHFGAKRNWYLNFGPYVGFLLDAKDTRFDMDLKESHNNVDAGLAVGIGVKIPVNNYVKIFVEYQEQAGVIDIFKESYGFDPVLNSRSAFNIGINFML